VQVDLNAEFPTENYQDLAEHGFLKLVIPEEYGGYGFSLGEYATIGAEIGKYCGATALTFNMHTSSMMWLRFMYEMPHLSAEEKAAFGAMRERPHWPVTATTTQLFARSTLKVRILAMKTPWTLRFTKIAKDCLL